ncbi:MAG: flavodoxin family protein [Candidatus Bathyarchaeia archaeon]
MISETSLCNLINMKIIGFNGSPRKGWNTYRLVESALRGAESKGAETELINLYDLKFSGCISCFSCKTKGSQSYGRCAIQDELTPILARIFDSVGGVVFGSPIYLGTVSAGAKAFLERLIFPYLAYKPPPRSLFPRQIPTLAIYTMNARDEERMKEMRFDAQIVVNERLLKMIFGHTKTLCSFDTYQFEDYSKVVSDMFDVGHKMKVREEKFPLDLQRAYDLGAEMASFAAG